jgi:hypothetical protein
LKSLAYSGLFHGVALLCIAFGGALNFTHPLVATYTPPFDYISAKTLGYTSFADDNWFNALVGACGSAARVYELMVPNTMVDSNGNLYGAAVDNWSGYFGGKGHYIVRIDPSGIQYTHAHMSGNYIEGNYTWPIGRTPTPNQEDGTYDHFKRRSWMGLTPCIARECNGSSDYVYRLVYVLPSRWWNSSSGGDTEGFLLLKIRKSDHEVMHSSFLPYTTRSEVCMGYFPGTYINSNKVAFSACHDVNGGKVYCQWLTADSRAGPQVHTRTITFDTNQNTWSSCSTLSMDNTVSDYRSCSLEPRTIKGVNGIYALAVRNGYYPYINKVNTTTNYWTVWGNGLHGSGWDTTDCSYHADFEIVKASDNTELFLVLMYSYGNRCNAMNSENADSQCWTTHYVSWGMSNIVLHIQSSTTGTNWTSGPENVIYTTTVAAGSASTAETLSTSTLYKCTHKLVAYHNHIIYAYCYPGRKTHLILGVARYFIDSNRQFHLSIKREFIDSSGNSFGNLTNCSRIISMDVSANGHLWITWMSADNQTYYYFHANAQDVIDHAI